MGVLSLVLLLFTHPSEVRSLIHYKVWRDPLNDITRNPEESGYNREQMRACWHFLDLTSRSFAAVIKELRGELGRVICLFYLILRALDTVEDDMTIPPETKIPLLVDFYKKLEQPGWNFKDSGPNEKDRELLVQFEKVIAEFQLLTPNYRTVISDITAKMGAGMASYIEASATSPLKVQAWADYDLYCHFVAGLVGEGLSRLFSESSIERPWLGDQLQLSNHMGLFLQKTNIIRDYAEDCAESRFFWPRDCWGDKRYNGGFDAQADVARGIEPIGASAGGEVVARGTQYQAVGADGKAAMHVLSGMLADAVSHATHSLDYLAVLRDQSVFNFCAIPQVMAIATLEALAGNPDVFKRNVKIRKSQAVQLIIRAVNPRDVAYTFLTYARKIHKKITPDDPNYVRWGVELGRIETWCETYYPSFVSAAQDNRQPDVRAAALKPYVTAAASGTDLPLAPFHGGTALYAGKELDENIVATAADVYRARLSPEKRKLQEQNDQKDAMRVFFFVMMGVSGIFALTALIAWLVVWYIISPDTTDPLTLFVREQYAAVGQHVSGLRSQLVSRFAKTEL
ncbi:bifunctional farnesyl-diphosphate farnesyltransferase/squalene synthase [Tilletia horrida]|uniref:Squalene synthase n=1 Tax=Tilletia horrida TaxID=155126 RepID=A0AAN6JM17_9BASI|nr:bifunctional farnesyl-diphosphate farnesyltransferase/squalene synthase [Tilletia horrida]KAK0536475.1 bifunctional farnesyl-diphosphate farnesyltransferase/squalene synthase [Tilletia horrida]